MPRSLGIAAVALSLACSTQQPPPPAESGLQPRLEEAARRYGVPAPVVIAAAWVQTRLSMNPGFVSRDSGVGLFHLVDRDDAPAEVSLRRAAELIGRPAAELRTDPFAHALGYAALLRETADRVFGQYKDLDEHRLGDWFEVLMLSSGFEDARAADDYASDVFRVMRDGLVAAGDDGSVVRLSPQAFSLEGRAIWGTAAQGLTGEYCPNGTCVRFVAASTSNYTSGRSARIDHIVIHDMEGTYAGAISWFQNPAAGASAHYDIRSSDGEITQQVKHADTAWHAGNWNINSRSIGIEHEGYAASGSRWYTEAMYKSSAALVRFLTDKYAIPKDRAHIIGHYEVPDPNHSGWYGGAGHHHDPCKVWDGSPTWHNVTGCDWNWSHYMSLVTGSTPPTATGVLTGFVGDACCGLSASTRKPLVGATVTLAGTSQSTKTDATGMYKFSLPAGTYTPKASFTGYVTGDHSSVGSGVSAAVDVDAGQTSWGSILLKKETTVAAPKVVITAPANGATVSSTPVAVRGTVDDKSVGQVKLNGTAINCSNGAFSGSVALVAGRNTITATATNAGGTGTASIVVTYSAPPPPPASKGSVAGVVTDSDTGAAIASAGVAVEGSSATAQTDATGRYRLDLDPGNYKLAFGKTGFRGVAQTVTVTAGQVASLDVELQPIETVPTNDANGRITLKTPPDGIETGGDEILVSGTVEVVNFARLMVGELTATVDAQGAFAQVVKLAPGLNQIDVRAFDKDGKFVQVQVRVLYTPPAPPILKLADTGCSTGGTNLLTWLGIAATLMLRRRKAVSR